MSATCQALFLALELTARNETRSPPSGSSWINETQSNKGLSCNVSDRWCIRKKAERGLSAWGEGEGGCVLLARRTRGAPPRRCCLSRSGRGEGAGEPGGPGEQCAGSRNGRSRKGCGECGDGEVTWCPSRCQGADGAGENGGDQVSVALRVPARNLDYI